MYHLVHILPSGIRVEAEDRANLLDVLRRYELAPDAPCGGKGTCGKCIVTVNGVEHRACNYEVRSSICVQLPDKAKNQILITGVTQSIMPNPAKDGYLAAVDIGTTTVVCYLLSPDGKQLAVQSMLNPQTPFGADVISRMQRALDGDMNRLTGAIRKGLCDLLLKCCTEAGISSAEIGIISVVGNPCMQQLFMGISPENLAKIPFAPVLVSTDICDAEPYLPCCSNAKLLVIPDISGYVGADTMACVLASGLYRAEDTVLMVDIGTNGEMVLCHNGKIVACSTAAGPALEGASIHFGMRGTEGAIDHVWVENGTLCFSVIGGVAEKGICGSGLIDAVAVMLDCGLLNKRGRIQSQTEMGGERIFPLGSKIYLTQEDIRQVQMAKGAIAAGIHLMAEYLGTTVTEIDRVILAGAFGSFLRPENACKIGLLPAELDGKITSAGNIAGSGAKMLALDKNQLQLAQKLVERIEFLELASMSGFRKTFAANMNFSHTKC